MRGVFSLTLAILIFAAILSLYFSYSNTAKVSEAFHKYLADLRAYHIRRDLEFSLSKALEYGLENGPEYAEERVGYFLRRWYMSWKGRVELEANVECYSVGRDGNKLYAVLLCPIEGRVGDLRIYIPKGFRREITWSGG